jgi:dienelactone hydrolase
LPKHLDKQIKQIMKSLSSCLLLLCSLVSALAFAAPVDISFTTRQNITLTGKLYLPAASSRLVPAVVLMHGCAGIFSHSDPTKGLALAFTEWGERLSNAGYIALLVDSFSARHMPQNQCGNGNEGVSEVTDRPYDAYGASKFLTTAYSARIDPARIALLGWSHGASSTISAISTTMAGESGTPFKAGFALYPGCGLYGAFGGIRTSTYTSYAPLHILHGGADPLYTVGYCAARIHNAINLGSALMDMVVYPGAQHGFDRARKAGAKWTQADVDAKAAADAHVMRALDKLFR